nr:unnamed protein product [Leishmania braziliensis]CAJ2472476.1 unnamed protein product [Leishmania braziliensis]
MHPTTSYIPERDLVAREAPDQVPRRCRTQSSRYRNGHRLAPPAAGREWTTRPGRGHPARWAQYQALDVCKRRRHLDRDTEAPPHVNPGAQVLHLCLGGTVVTTSSDQWTIKSTNRFEKECEPGPPVMAGTDSNYSHKANSKRYRIVIAGSVHRDRASHNIKNAKTRDPQNAVLSPTTETTRKRIREGGWGGSSIRWHPPQRYHACTAVRYPSWIG